MAERLTKCPECQSIFTTVLKLHNPDTHDMNCNATVECDKCKHVWEDKVTSPYFKKQKHRGFWL